MHTYPADERRISDVEQGRSCEAVVPLPPDGSLLAGDAILFALCESRPGQPECFVKGGDSIAVSLTEVTALEATDPATGRALVHLTWKRLGQAEPPVPKPTRASRPRRARGSA